MAFGIYQLDEVDLRRLTAADERMLNAFLLNPTIFITPFKLDIMDLTSLKNELALENNIENSLDEDPRLSADDLIRLCKISPEFKNAFLNDAEAFIVPFNINQSELATTRDFLLNQ